MRHSREMLVRNSMLVTCFKYVKFNRCFCVCAFFFIQVYRCFFDSIFCSGTACLMWIVCLGLVKYVKNDQRKVYRAKEIKELRKL